MAFCCLFLKSNTDARRLHQLMDYFMFGCRRCKAELYLDKGLVLVVAAAAEAVVHALYTVDVAITPVYLPAVYL